MNETNIYAPREAPDAPFKEGSTRRTELIARAIEACWHSVEYTLHISKTAHDGVVHTGNVETFHRMVMSALTLEAEQRRSTPATVVFNPYNEESTKIKGKVHAKENKEES